MGIFSDTAPGLWAAGLPAIPLAMGQKNPVFEGWSRFGTEMPSAEIQAGWLAGCAPGNVGLPLGPAGGVVVIDVDTDDVRVMELVERLAGVSVWKRVGAKGAALAYRYTDESTKRIVSKDKAVGTIVEILSTGTQIVLPPSIHPDTKQPYVATCDLAAAKLAGDLKPLPPDFVDSLRVGLEGLGFELNRPGAAKVSVFVPAGERNVRMTSMAGVLARGVQRGERTLKEALDEISEWVKSLVEDVVGDNSVTVEKAQSKLIEFMLRDLKGISAASLPVGWDAGISDADKTAWGIDVPADKVRLGYIEINAMVLGIGQAVDKIGEVEKIVTRVAQNKDLTELQTNALLGETADLVKVKGITRAVLMKQVNSIRGGDIRGESHGEIATHLLDQLRGDGEILFSRGDLRQWVGAFWEKRDPEVILKKIVDDYQDLPAARRASDFDGILRTLKTLSRGDTGEEQGFNFANGWVNNRGELRAHDMRYGADYRVDYLYDEEKAQNCPQFFQLLENLFGHQKDYAEKLLCLQEIFGITLFRAATTFNKVFCLYGYGSTGKTTLLNILKGLVPGDMICSIPPTTWGETFVPAHLGRHLINLCGELPENAMVDGASFKQIVEGAQIMVQKKQVDAYHISPDCSHWFATNHLPKTRDYSSGFYRRWLFLNFDRRFSRDEVVVNLDKKILNEEREAIAAWAVQGYLRAAETGRITEPQGHRDVLDKMITQNNNVLRWLQDRNEVQYGAGLKISKVDAYHSYKFVCQQGMMRPCSPFEFEHRLEEIFLDMPCSLVGDDIVGLDRAIKM